MRLLRMAIFRITLVNDVFASADEQEFSDLDAARRQGLKAALEVGVEQVMAGQPLSASEVTVSDGNSNERFVVTVGSSKLKQ